MNSNSQFESLPQLRVKNSLLDTVVIRPPLNSCKIITLQPPRSISPQPLSQKRLATETPFSHGTLIWELQRNLEQRNLRLFNLNASPDGA